MNWLVYFVLIFPCGALATTLLETGAAVGIANTLQGTVQTQPQKILDKTRKTVKKYEKAQQVALEGVSKTVPPIGQNKAPAPNRSTDISINSSSERLRNLTKDELDKRFQDEGIYQETKPVDYKRSVQVFYKRECPPSQKNCDRGAVLTNIKSVIFDYAHTRGSFAESK